MGEGQEGKMGIDEIVEENNKRRAIEAGSRNYDYTEIYALITKLLNLRILSVRLTPRMEILRVLY